MYSNRLKPGTSKKQKQAIEPAMNTTKEPHATTAFSRSGQQQATPKTSDMLMQLKMRNVYLLGKEFSEEKTEDVLQTAFTHPEMIEKDLFGWNVHITSRSRNPESNHILAIETVTQYQFSSPYNMSVEYRNRLFLDKFAELVYAAHCHHAALFIASTSEFETFDGFVPEFMNWNSVKKLTEQIIMKD